MTAKTGAKKAAPKTKKTARPAVKSSHPQLPVEKRRLRGHQVKKLRRQGILPANIYGHNIKSLMVQVDLAEAAKFLDQYGETNVVDILVAGEKKPRPALMKNPQYDPVSDQLLHLDFYQVDLSEKVKAEIPVVVRGEAPAVERGEGVLVQVINELEVEALPTDLPEEIGVDVSKLDQVGQQITVKDLDIDRQKVVPQAGEDQVVVKIEAVTKEEEKPAEAAEGEEGKAAAGEGEKPAEEGEAKEGGEGKTSQEGEKAGGEEKTS